MADRKNVFAWTDPTTGSYPPFVSVNLDNAGELEITVRSPPRDGRDGATAGAVLPADQGRELMRALVALYAEPGEKQ